MVTRPRRLTGRFSDDADRFASIRVRRAAAARDVRAAGTASPVPKMHLVGRLSAKRRVRKHAVEFVDVERRELSDGGDAVQRVEEEPLMFESGRDARPARDR